MILEHIFLLISVVLEPFPVSSSGNALLAELLLHRLYGIEHISMPSFAEYIVHGPIVLVVATFFYKRWKLLVFHPCHARFIIGKMIVLVGIADSITMLWYILLSMTGKTFFPLWLGFMCTTGLLLSLRYIIPVGYTQKHIITACVLGMAQGCALLPGISRFGITFVAARWLGFSDKKSFELSFLIEFPISCAATFLGSYLLIHTKDYDRLLNHESVLGMVIASLVAWAGFYIVSYCIHIRSMWLFSVYTGLIALIALSI